MNPQYRVQDNDEERGPFDIETIQAMFYRGRLSNKAQIREAHRPGPWKLITVEYPQWGIGRDVAVATPSDRKPIVSASHRVRFRSTALGWACFVAACLVWVAPIAYYNWAENKAKEKARLREPQTDLFASYPRRNELPYEREARLRNLQKERVAANNLRRSEQPSQRLWEVIWVCVAVPSSAILFWYGRRLRSISGEALLARDKRPPVVYFRSFGDDMKLALPTEKLASTVGPKRFRTEEEEIVKYLRWLGPVIALGDPKETVPLSGASRFYSTHDSWQAKAEDLLLSAGLVVYRCGMTKGIVWELTQGRKHLRPEKVVLLVPPSEGEFPPPGYSWFRQQMAGVLRLPEQPSSPIITFGCNWIPVAFGDKDRSFFANLRKFASTHRPVMTPLVMLLGATLSYPL